MTKSIAAILAVLGLASTAAFPAAGEPPPRRPNMVFFLVDDMGWQETSVVIEDFFPTILELAGAEWRGKTLQAVDGLSFVPLLKGEGRTPSDRALVWHFPNNYGGQTPFSAIRQGPWKLIYHQADRRLELFNIDTDIGETRDLAKENPAKVTQLAQLLGERLRAADAQMPTNKATGQPIEWPDQVVGKSSAVRVACLGDSITFGTGASPPERYLIRRNSPPCSAAATRFATSGSGARRSWLRATSPIAGNRNGKLRWILIPTLSCSCSARTKPVARRGTIGIAPPPSCPTPAASSNRCVGPAGG